MVVKWIVMHSCCSAAPGQQHYTTTPQQHNFSKYLLEIFDGNTGKILQHLIIYLAFEIHIIWYQLVTTQRTPATHFKCPLQWQEGKWREKKNTGIMMNYVANHHVSDRWLIDSGKQLDAPVGMAGFCLCLVHLSSDRNECWVTIRSNAQHPSSLYDAAPSTMWILLGDLVLLQLLHRTFNMNKEKENGDGISFKWTLARRSWR